MLIYKQNLHLLLVALLSLVLAPSQGDATCRAGGRLHRHRAATEPPWADLDDEDAGDNNQAGANNETEARDFQQLAPIGDQEALELLTSRLPSDCGKAPKTTFSPYIAGGFSAQAGDYPSYVKLEGISLKDGFRSFTCGGTLISDRHVVTAAHCLVGATEINLVFTVHSNDYQALRRTARESQFCSSPKYAAAVHRDPSRLNHDLGLITIEPVQFSDTIQPACLPLKPVETKRQLMAVGLGVSRKGPAEDSPIEWPDSLQVLPVKLQHCDPADQHLTKVCFVHSDPKHVGDTCGGDSGGPIYGYESGKMTLVAATSYGPSLCEAGMAGKSVNTDLLKTKAELGRLMAECGGAGAAKPADAGSKPWSPPGSSSEPMLPPGASTEPMLPPGANTEPMLPPWSPPNPKPKPGLLPNVRPKPWQLPWGKRRPWGGKPAWIGSNGLFP